jgi:hypothetical protein
VKAIQNYLEITLFIVTRAEAAAETYAQAIRNGSNQFEATEQANIILFHDLHFSMHNTLTNILWNEFSGVIPEEDIGRTSLFEKPDAFKRYNLNWSFTVNNDVG